MVMRGKFILTVILLAAVLSLSGCVKSIERPSDELRMYTWSGSFDNGADVTLSFSQTDGYLAIEGDEPLHISGLCMLTDDVMLIFDDNSGMNYSFGYHLYGDRVELSRDGSVLTLKKNDSN